AMAVPDALRLLEDGVKSPSRIVSVRSFQTAMWHFNHTVPGTNLAPEGSFDRIRDIGKQIAEKDVAYAALLCRIGFTPIVVMMGHPRPDVDYGPLLRKLPPAVLREQLLGFRLVTPTDQHGQPMVKP